MIIGTGIDIIEIHRISRLMKNERFFKKMFTEDEIKYLSGKNPQSTAGYFCAKEAVVKAMGTGFSGFNFTDVEICKIDSAPIVKLHGRAYEIAANKGIHGISVSISHSNEYATAVAVAEDCRNTIGLVKEGSDGIWQNTMSNYPLNVLKKRERESHKGNYGKLFVIGGSYSMSGAVALCSKAALRAGSGLVTCVVPGSIADRVGGYTAEVTFKICNEKLGAMELTCRDIDEIMDKADAIAFGVGAGVTSNLQMSLAYLVENSSVPIVIDADGINLLAGIKESMARAKSQIVITPHIGEMSRLTGRDKEYIANNRVEVAREFAAKYNCIVLLKGPGTVVTDGTRIYINSTGNPGMATAGSGDVLTGIVASFIGQGYNEYDAAVLGAYIHGAAGDRAYEKYGFGLIAGDIMDFLGNYLKG